MMRGSRRFGITLRLALLATGAIICGEIFHPPYLFKGARPSITSAPAWVHYGESFPVATPNTAQVTSVRWIRLGSVTHAFESPNLAPPGFYQLMLLNRNGVPSPGTMIQVQ